MLILFGSISSYIVKQVVKSEALYGRINLEMSLETFFPNEIYTLLEKKCCDDEILLYSFIVGGIPKYLQEINPNKSFEQNINELLFTQNGLLVNEYQRIFYSQFKEP